MIDCEWLANYFSIYIKAYNKEFNRFVTPLPEGGGYPSLVCSPYLYAKEFHICIAKDGVVIFVYKSSVPTEFLKNGPIMNLIRPIKDFEKKIFSGTLPKPLKEFNCDIDEGPKIKIHQFNMHIDRLVQTLTVGNINYSPDSDSDFWTPYIIINIEFVSKFSKKKYDYMEIYPHIDKSAWDIRSIWAKVHLDLRRDFLNSILNDNKEAGFMMHYPEGPQVYDRLVIFEKAINDFESLLNDETNENEVVFHDFLKENPLLLDFYGIPISKPRFYYPEGESPLGKKYVEPDFIIQYPGNRYKLVELERPSKSLATIQGQPRSEVSQAAFQISEWQMYIKKHYDSIKDQFPSIYNNSSMVVISRSTEESIGQDRDLMRYIELINEQFKPEIITYDDLLERAKEAYIQLSNLLCSKGELFD